jgi:hypothetical protein
MHEAISMPRRLLERCRSDSIREFRAAARQRCDDALALAASGHRTGAIYLWGYSAEMTLKAAYFLLVGLTETDQITWQGHLQPAINRGQGMGIVWPKPGAGHNVRAWAELLVAERALEPATAYATKFGLDVQRQGQRIGQLWRETLRYSGNLAYSHEVTQVRNAAEWLLVNSHIL